MNKVFNCKEHIQVILYLIIRRK